MSLPPKPSELTFWFLYLGGCLMCIGYATYVNLPWPFFWYWGEWTVAFALVSYLLGWWRAKSW